MENTLSGAARISRHPNHLGTDVAGQTVLMNVEKGKYVGLDSIGTAIWTRLERSVTLDGLCQELLTAYDAPPDVLRRDVETFVKKMHDLGLVEIA